MNERLDELEARADAAEARADQADRRADRMQVRSTIDRGCIAEETDRNDDTAGHA